MVRSGALTPAEGADLLAKQGLNPTLVQAYIADATRTKAAAQKQLSLSTVLGMYEAKSITAEQAATFIKDLGYTAAEADAELAYADYTRAHKGLQAAVNRVGAAYVARKIDATEATAALATLGVPGDAITQQIQTWDVERTTQVRVLSEAQIATAFYYELFSTDPATNQATAVQNLQDLGYSAYDAWVLLSNRAKGPLPNRPPG
jgi:hypothetical protein